MDTADAIDRVVWDVPARLVHRDEVGPLGPVVQHRVTLGRALADVTTVDVATVQVGDAVLLRAITPAPADAASATQDLVTLLDHLRADGGDGRVGVLIEGSAFSRAVLEALCAIPAGARRTYAELAAAAGRPRAVRAAATVMARNRTPLVLPCHRVVPSGGGTGRYAWGGAVKAALLDAEASAGRARTSVRP